MTNQPTWYELVQHLASTCASVPVCICSTSGFLVQVFSRALPALSEEDLEAVRAALRYWQLEAVVPHTPDDGGGVHVFIRDLSRQHFPQHYSKGP